MKLPNFLSPSADSSSKIGRHFSNKAVLKLKLAKNAFYKKRAPKQLFFNEKKNSKRFGQFLTQKIHFESPKLALFDELSANGDTKFGNFI